MKETNLLQDWDVELEVAATVLFDFGNFKVKINPEPSFLHGWEKNFRIEQKPSMKFKTYDDLKI